MLRGRVISIAVSKNYDSLKVTNEQVGAVRAEIMDSPSRFVRIAVSAVYKGFISSDTVTIITSLRGASCGYSFSTGGDYIVYATTRDETLSNFGVRRKSSDDKTFWTHRCTRTRPWHQEEEDAIRETVRSSPFMQDTLLKARLEKMPGVVKVTPKLNRHFKEYYELFVEQPLDHAKPQGKKFRQRIFLGCNDAAAPVVLEAEGYSCYASSLNNHTNECVTLLDGNLIVAEHRYFGYSAPDSLDWSLLTMQQAANDLHRLKEIFGTFFTGKWIATGTSKGGQAALAYRLYFPGDAHAALIYSTPLKEGLYDPRIEKFMAARMQSAEGKKIRAFQEYFFRHKKEWLPAFDSFCRRRKWLFEMDVETVLDYCLLEYPFAFLQGGHDAGQIPDTAQTAEECIKHLASVIPLRFYTDDNQAVREAAFYMFYHELGYYEYDTAPFEKWLKHKNGYPNAAFLPEGIKTTYDGSYSRALQEAIAAGKMKRTLFLYGEHDPWAATQPELGASLPFTKLIVKNGSHNSRLADLSEAQKREAENLLREWMRE